MDNKPKTEKGPPPSRVNPKTQPGWPGAAPEVDPSLITATYEGDVVVLGAGHAGVQCALAAAEGGAKVIVAEKQPEFEKLHWTGEQIGTYNSGYFIERGFGPYDEMEIIQEYFRCGCHRVNQRLISMYVRNSGEMLDHALSLIPEDSTLLDEDQCNIHQAYYNDYPIVAGGNRSWAGTLQFRGKLITERGITVAINGNSRLSEVEMFSVRRSAELGAEWFCGWSGVCLEKTGDRVTAVIAKNRSGEYARFIGKRAVCVTTGNNTDTGHKMCVWAGGNMEIALRDTTMPYDASPFFGMTAFLALNARGERFCNESDAYCLGPQINRQPRGIVTTVFDSNWMEYLKVNGIQHGMPDMAMTAYLEQAAEDISHVVEHGAEGYDVRNLSASERETGHMWGANTLPELADHLGYTGEDKARWLKSIERYNELCRAGFDEDYGKDKKALIPIEKPPFYAGRVMNAKASGDSDAMCPSGLATDNSMNVTDADGNVIPGLYVAGNTLGGRYFLYYPTPSGGNMIGMAMTHGRVLGKLLTDQPFRK